MKIQLDSVYERDMDFLFMRKLAHDKDFVRQFFLSGRELIEKGYDKADFSIINVAHSVMTEDGESDIEAVLSIEGKKVALLIEDKIDAIAQPEQASRYRERGNKGLADGDYDEYYIFIVAPKIYLNTNDEARNYPYSVSYEEVLNYFENKNDSRSVFKASQIKQAICIFMFTSLARQTSQIYIFFFSFSQTL